MRLFVTAILLTFFLPTSRGQSILQAWQKFLNTTPVKGAHAGILIVDAESLDTIFKYQSEKYFIPASTTKLFTMYAVMKWLSDSLPGIRVLEEKDIIRLFPTGDPTLMNRRFLKQPVLNYLKQADKQIILCQNNSFQTTALAPGWSVDDFDQTFMPERSALPLNGNIFTFGINSDNQKISIPNYPFPIQLASGNEQKSKRNPHENIFYLEKTRLKESVSYDSAPFITSLELAAKLLSSEIKKAVAVSAECLSTGSGTPMKTIYSEKTDTVLKIMMHESDNFLAEQLLLMASLVSQGFMDEKKTIDALLNGELTGLPHPPKWVDGSGLSRYNLFSPEDFTYLLKKMITDYGWNRMANILPSGGKGTLSGYYESKIPYLYAKTGSLSNNSCLSGILITKNDKKLLFSVMINNHLGKSAPVRRALASFLQEVREN